MSLPVLLITGMALPPFSAAVADDLGVFGIIDDPPAMVFGAPPPLALWLIANALLGVESRSTLS